MWKYSLNILKHVILTCLWTAFLVKLFVFDFDTYIIIEWLKIPPLVYSYKVLASIFILMVFSLTMKRWKFWLMILYVVFYPVIVIVWYIPKLLFTTKKFFGLIVFADVVIHFVNKIKKKLFLLFLLVLGIICINVLDQRWTIISGMAVLTGFLLYFGISNLIIIFAPLRLFSIDVVKSVNTLLDDKKSKKKKDKTIKENPPLPKEFKNREMLWMTNRLLWFCGNLLDIVEERKLYVFYFFMKFTFIVIITTGIVCEINYGFYKLNTNNFTIESGSDIIPSIFAYTVNSYLYNDIGYITVNNDWPRIFRLFFQIYFTGLILSIAGFFYSVMSERFAKAINMTRKLINKQYDRNTRFIKAKFKVSPDELYDQLKTIGSQTIHMIEKYFTDYMEVRNSSKKNKSNNTTPNSLRP